MTHSPSVSRGMEMNRTREWHCLLVAARCRMLEEFVDGVGCHIGFDLDVLTGSHLGVP